MNKELKTLMFIIDCIYTISVTQRNNHLPSFFDKIEIILQKYFD